MPVGNDVESAWRSIRTGRSGIGRLTHFEPSHIDTHIAGEVRDFDADALFGRREARRTDRFVQYALAAGHQALDDAGFLISDSNRYDIGCVVGTWYRRHRYALFGYPALHRSRTKRRESADGANDVAGRGAAGKVSIDFGIRGPNWSINTACATGNNCIGDAAELIPARPRQHDAGG